MARVIACMTTSIFRIVPLRTEIAEAARHSASKGAPEHTTVVADSANAYPCRHCLSWAQPGERVILFPYAAIPSGYSYSESGPIIVHEHQCTRYAPVQEYPATLRSGRAFR